MEGIEQLYIEMLNSEATLCQVREKGSDRLVASLPTSLSNQWRDRAVGLECLIAWLEGVGETYTSAQITLKKPMS